MTHTRFTLTLSSAVSLAIWCALPTATQAQNPFDVIKQMMIIAQPIMFQAAVDHCPTHFAIADPKAHAAGLAKAKKTFVNPGDYHYSAIKTRYESSVKGGGALCDKAMAEFKSKGHKELVYKR